MEKKEMKTAILFVGFIVLFAIVGFLVGLSWSKMPFRKTALTPQKEAEELTSVEVNGVTYEGKVFTDGVIYAIYDGDETLTFAGNGAIVDRSDWVELTEKECKKVRTIVVEDGITYIDDYEFSGNAIHAIRTIRVLPNLEKVEIRGHLMAIKSSAFSANYALKSIVFEQGCDKVELYAFGGLSPEAVSGIELDDTYFKYIKAEDTDSKKKYSDSPMPDDDPIPPMSPDEWEELDSPMKMDF